MKINATLTRCRHGKPLVQLDSAPFNGMEIRPAELRYLAQQLTAIADEAERQPTGKHWMAKRIELGAKA